MPPTCARCGTEATRQEYADTQTPNPWDAENYVPLCRDHAGPSSWPLIQS